MNSFDEIGNAMMILFDELKNDKASKKIIEMIDNAKNDKELKAGFKDGLKRLRELGKNTLADDLEQKIKNL